MLLENCAYIFSAMQMIPGFIYRWSQVMYPELLGHIISKTLLCLIILIEHFTLKLQAFQK